MTRACNIVRSFVRRPATLALAFGGIALAGASGCGLIGNITRTTSIELRNDGEFDVELDMYIYDEQLAPLGVIIADGEHIETIIEPGESRAFIRPCDDLQAVVIVDADLDVVGSIGPSVSTGVLRDGDDFSCGSLIRFTFDHSSVLIDFDVDIDVFGD